MGERVNEGKVIIVALARGIVRAAGSRALGAVVQSQFVSNRTVQNRYILGVVPTNAAVAVTATAGRVRVVRPNSRRSSDRPL